jgi:peptide/nickel transport system permease protein
VLFRWSRDAEWVSFVTRRYLLVRVSQSVLALVIVMLIDFFMFRVLLPGDPFAHLSGGARAHLTPAERQELIHEFGLDRPRWVQFGLYAQSFVAGRLGTSSYFNEPVTTVLKRYFPPTLLLITLALVISIPLGLGLAVGSVRKPRGWLDRSSSLFSIVLFATPTFWLGMLLLMVFSVGLGWFPIGGRISTALETKTPLTRALDIAHHVFLPALALGLGHMAEVYLITRASLRDSLSEDYIVTARAKGLHPREVVRRHALRNAALPVVTIIGLTFGFMISGAIVVEVVFSHPGLGVLTDIAIRNRDYWLLQSLFFLFSALVIGLNLSLDVLYAYLDPRVGTPSSGRPS